MLRKNNILHLQLGTTNNDLKNKQTKKNRKNLSAIL